MQLGLLHVQGLIPGRHRVLRPGLGLTGSERLEQQHEHTEHDAHKPPTRHGIGAALPCREAGEGQRSWGRTSAEQNADQLAAPKVYYRMMMN